MTTFSHHVQFFQFVFCQWDENKMKKRFEFTIFMRAV